MDRPVDILVLEIGAPSAGVLERGLVDLGYTDVWSMVGGFKGWVSAGYIVVNDES